MDTKTPEQQYKTDFERIGQIADKAIELVDGFTPAHKQDLVMDLDFVHDEIGLRLGAMLEAANSEDHRFDFVHDVVGIWNHWDRQRLVMTDCFMPRFANL